MKMRYCYARRVHIEEKTIDYYAFNSQKERNRWIKDTNECKFIPYTAQKCTRLEVVQCFGRYFHTKLVRTWYPMVVRSCYLDD